MLPQDQPVKMKHVAVVVQFEIHKGSAGDRTDLLYQVEC
jgi:hypothetical protein